MSDNQKIVCEKVNVELDVPERGSKLGLAISTIGIEPINGVRVAPENGTNGWYIWCGGEMSEDDDFFSPLHVDNIEEYLPVVNKYLGLPPGYRFQVDNSGYEDIWYDESLLNN